jgi:hypothetical protein
MTALLTTLLTEMPLQTVQRVIQAILSSFITVKSSFAGGSSSVPQLLHSVNIASSAGSRLTSTPRDPVK